MRAVVLAMLVACYGAPDYTGTAFKCDTQHPCPDGEQCISGVCRGGSGSGSGSNMADGIKCGGTLVCPANMDCCANPTGLPSCIQHGAQCAYVAASCDGLEDCGTGEQCCDGSKVECRSDCGGAVTCTDNGDCPAVEPLCCHFDTTVPWGQCGPSC